MFKGTRLTTALFAAIVITVALAGSASARNISVSSATVRATWARLSFSPPLGATIVCPVTLEGALHSRTFVKGNYNLVGNITRAEIGTRLQCSAAEATILKETLPWNLRYLSFEGRLPDITNTRLLLAGAAFSIHSIELGFTCLFTTRETVREHGAGAFNREAGGAITSVDFSGEITSNEFCALGTRIAGRLSGRSTSLTQEGTGARITLTLI